MGPPPGRLADPDKVWHDPKRAPRVWPEDLESRTAARLATRHAVVSLSGKDPEIVTEALWEALVDVEHGKIKDLSAFLVAVADRVGR